MQRQAEHKILQCYTHDKNANVYFTKKFHANGTIVTLNFTPIKLNYHVVMCMVRMALPMTWMVLF